MIELSSNYLRIQRCNPQCLPPHLGGKWLLAFSTGRAELVKAERQHDQAMTIYKVTPPMPNVLRFNTGIRDVIAGSVLALISTLAIANPAADEHFDGDVIAMYWNSRYGMYEREASRYEANAPQQALLLVQYLDQAFDQAGFSLDKSFRKWLEVVGSPGQDTLYPEMVAFGEKVGFDQVNGYLKNQDPRYRDSIYATQILSKKTRGLLDLYQSSESSAKHDPADGVSAESEGQGSPITEADIGDWK